MAELTVDDVVDQSLSVGDLSPSDAPATTPNTASNLAGEESSGAEVALKENGIHNPNSIKIDELEDASVRSDTDTSRAEGSVGDDKPTDSRPVKKFAASKPVSFAKYSVPKVIAANAAVKGADKGGSLRRCISKGSANNLQYLLLRAHLHPLCYKQAVRGWWPRPRARYNRRPRHTNR